MWVGVGRSALYGLLIYREGDRARTFFGYGLDRDEVMLGSQPHKPARDHVHELQFSVFIDVEVRHLSDAPRAGVQDLFLAEFVVRRLGVLVALQPDQVHSEPPFPSAVRRKKTPHRALLHQRGQEPSDRKDGQFSATLRAEGGTHRPCGYCIKHPLPAQRARCSSTFRVDVFRRREGRGLGPPPDRLTTVARAWGYAPRTAHMPPRAAHSTGPR